VQNFRARFHRQIRSGPDARWMSFTGEQYNFYDQPSRLFLMDASMFGVLSLLKSPFLLGQLKLRPTMDTLSGR
jgi:hypothetical protein